MPLRSNYRILNCGCISLLRNLFIAKKWIEGTENVCTVHMGICNGGPETNEIGNRHDFSSSSLRNASHVFLSITPISAFMSDSSKKINEWNGNSQYPSVSVTTT